MHLICVLAVLCGLLGQHVCSQPNKNFNKLSDAEWQCDTVCLGSGGKAEFDPKNNICKCTLDKNTDAVDQELISKIAKAFGLQLTVAKNSDISKRHIDALGQRSPQIRITPRPRALSTTRRPSLRPTPTRIITSTRRRTTVITPINVQERMQQIQNRINERRINRTRNRSGPHLQQRSGFPTETTPDLMERLRERQRELQEKRKNKTIPSTSATSNAEAKEQRTNPDNTNGSSTSPVIVAIQKDEETSNKKLTKEVSGAKEKKSFEVITQDPSLY